MCGTTFFLVKEALTNALKHSAAKEVQVRAKAAAGALEIIVQDDGRGFDPTQALARGQQHGTGNMRRRAQTIGGTLTLRSAPGHGTTISLRVSLPGEAGLSGA
jgi:signal transduction histidine kinase